MRRRFLDVRVGVVKSKQQRSYYIKCQFLYEGILKYRIQYLF